jgi:uncharacterized membrane protein YeaQ/YmgE (transglycosylase-associated protein family)
MLVDRPQAFFNALLTEHFVLESARGITVSESSSRASLYLTTLSSSLVAFGFLSRTRFAAGFLATVIPVVVLLGIFSYERLVETSLEDVVALAAIQKIRRFYATVLPGGEEYFVVPDRPGAPNELLDIGRRASWRGVFITMSSAIGVVNSIVAGSGAALLATESGGGQTAAIVCGFITAVVLVLAHGFYQEHRYSAATRQIKHADDAGSQPPEDNTAAPK